VRPFTDLAVVTDGPELVAGERPARRIVVAALPVLAVFGACLFLPAFEVIAPRMVTPAELLSDGPLFGAFMTPLLLALPLLLLALAPLVWSKDGAPGRALGTATTLVVAATLVSPILLALFAERLATRLLAAALAALALYVLGRAQAHAVEGWRRQLGRLASFALASLPLALLVVRLEDERLGLACWLFVPAAFLLAAMTLPSLRVIKRG
jgi:hypothetical protein